MADWTVTFLQASNPRLTLWVLWRETKLYLILIFWCIDSKSFPTCAMWAFSFYTKGAKRSYFIFKETIWGFFAYMLFDSCRLELLYCRRLWNNTKTHINANPFFRLVVFYPGSCGNIKPLSNRTKLWSLHSSVMDHHHFSLWREWFKDAAMIDN